jgi:arylsulfatase A-like enzyme
MKQSAMAGSSEMIPRLASDVPVPTAMSIHDQDPLFKPQARPRPAPTAPNVLLVMIDDMGFGASSAFGGPCRMPAAEELAAGGLRYTRFHTTGICSPTRASLLTGRNHHAVGMGSVIGQSTEAPGYTGRMPKSAATIARVLTGHGYATGAFGKMHETPGREVSPVGPFDHWPTTGEGFQKFYGFMGGEVNQWYPSLYDGTTPVEQPKIPEEGYHLSEDIVDSAIGWMRDVRSLEDRPFFCYVSFGATHAPFHVDQKWVQPYEGEFGHGWEVQREVTLQRQKDTGIVPGDTKLPPWPDVLPQWAELSDDERRAASLLMELYAGFASHTDAQVGRLLRSLDYMGCREDTLVIYLLGDNGASAEGGVTGSVNEYLGWNGLACSAEDILRESHALGGPDTWPHYPAGWALAMDTPYQWFKQVASHYGGTRNGLIVSWPSGFNGRGELRHQWHHVVDIAPTLLAAAGITPPAMVDGVAQQPLDGVAMNYSFTDPHAKDHRRTQYFEVHGSRGIYHNGWVACTAHRRTPWEFLAPEEQTFANDSWELYDTNADWSQARDLAAANPARLSALKELFLLEAARNRVFPLDDRPFAVRRNANSSQPTKMTFHAGSRRLPSEAIPNTIGRSFELVADVTATGDRSSGVICCQGGKFSGWSLYLAKGIVTYCHSVGRRERSFVRGKRLMSPGRHEIRFSFDYQGEGRGGAGYGRLFLDGAEIGDGLVPETVAFAFQLCEGFSVGIDPATPVSDEYLYGDNAFAGEIHRVHLALGAGEERTQKDAVLSELATQ